MSAPLINTAAWSWPQWLVVAFFVVEMILAAHVHGKPRGPASFWNYFIGNSLLGLVLALGGFFR